MTHATIFSGIGAAEIAAHSLGWRNLFNCDNNQFSQRVLKYHFPDALQYSFNIQAANFTIWRGRVDVLTGGFPCQPFSTAGKRRGTDDERYLWPEFLRAIAEIQPRWVVGENVFGIVSWSKGLVFEQVCSDLEAQGYQVTPYILPAAGVGAPHQRYRVFFVAYRANAGTQVQRKGQDGVCELSDATHSHSNRCRQWEHKQEHINGSSRTANTCACCEYGITANLTCDGLQARNTGRTSGERISLIGFDRFPTQSPVCGRNDGLSSRLDTTTILNGKPLTHSKWREESIKAYGNAIVPQVLLKIYQTIEDYEKDDV